MKQEKEREMKEREMKEDIRYLEKVFKKWSPHMLSSPYIPTPSLLIKQRQVTLEYCEEIEKYKKSYTTRPSNKFSKIRYSEIINCLHKGAYAYSVGDYGTAINYFTRLLEIDWLKYSSYFYLVKTLIKLDIEKEILSLRTQYGSNNVRLTKSK